MFGILFLCGIIYDGNFCVMMQPDFDTNMDEKKFVFLVKKHKHLPNYKLYFERSSCMKNDKEISKAIKDFALNEIETS